MKLITKAIEKAIEKHPLYSTDGQTKKKVICKFFNPCGLGTWLVFEGERRPNGDWLFFGLVDLYDKEMGYFTLSQLQSVKLPFGLTIERDKYLSNAVYDTETEELTC